VVQSGEGIWIYPTRQRRQRRFRHISAVEKAGLNTLNEGAKVSYEEKENRGKSSAENLRVG
jgi:cold shock CspA family protein